MAWIDDLATNLGEEPLSKQEISELLVVAREVAHRVERKITPLSTFVIGAAVARRSQATGSDAAARATAMQEVTAAVTAMLPPEKPETPQTPETG
jgi:hypothetical protein